MGGRSIGPAFDRSTREVSSKPHKSKPTVELELLSLPVVDSRVRACDPLAVVFVKQDRVSPSAELRSSIPEL